MENPTNPKSEATNATQNPTDREAFAMIRSLISEGHETNYERSKFAHDADEREAVENESRALDRLNTWLNDKEGGALAAPIKPDLSAVPLDALFIELHRRRGECVAFVITPQDVADYWECDDSGATHPGSRMPSADAWKAMRKAFERWMDCGGHSDVQQVMREEWIESDPESFAEAPTPWAIELRDHPGEPVFWNNQDGWGDAENADRFTDAEKQTLNLPIDGAWVRMGGVSK